MRMLGIGFVLLGMALMPHGAVPVEAAQKVKASTASGKTGTSPIVTGRFGIKQYDVSKPGKKKG
jgi:hypothetical protein